MHLPGAVYIRVYSVMPFYRHTRETLQVSEERYFIVEIVTPGAESKVQYRISVYNRETLLLSSLHHDEKERDHQCRWWEDFGYVAASGFGMEPSGPEESPN